jgi:hypothetical protein
MYILRCDFFMALLSLPYALSLLSIELTPASNGYWFDPVSVITIF